MSEKYKGYDLIPGSPQGLHVVYVYLGSSKTYMTGGELTKEKALEEAKKWIDESTECEPHGVLCCEYKDGKFMCGRRQV